MTHPPRSHHPPRSDPQASHRIPTEPEREPHGDLWSEHAGDLTRFATLLVGPHDAHDIVSIAFHRVTGRLDEGHQVRNVRAYLMQAVTNAATDQHRSQRRRRERDLRAAIASHSRPVDAPPGTELDIRRAVAELSMQQRAVVYFTYWEDLDSQQIARLLDIAPATVRRHLSRARFQLRKELS